MAIGEQFPLGFHNEIGVPEETFICEEEENLAIPLLQPQFVCGMCRDWKELLNGIMDTPIFAAEQRAQAQFHHRSSERAAAQSIPQIQQRIGAVREELVQLLAKLLELVKLGLVLAYYHSQLYQHFLLLPSLKG